MNASVGARALFPSDAERALFLAMLGDVVAASGIEVHGYALLPGHFHLLLRSHQGDLSQALQVLQSRYTVRLNRRLGEVGAIFQGRFRSQRLRRDRDLDALLPYLHLAPVRAGHAPTPEEGGWTSHRAYLGLEDAPAWLTTEVMLSRLGGPEGVSERVLAYAAGDAPWPEALDLATGFFRAGRSRAEPEAPLVDAEPLLALVTEVTGASLSTVRTARCGRGANPARRFATWALLRYTDLRHAQIGELLSMSTYQVAKSAERLRRRGLSPPLDRWAERLDVALDQELSGA